MICSVFVSVVLLYTTGGAVVENQKKGASCSGVEEEWRDGGLVCEPTCDQLDEEMCCVVRFKAGCFCADNTLRDHKGRCVPIHECPRPGMLTFNQTGSVVLEGASVASVVVSRVGGSRGRVTVRWRVTLPAPAPYSGVEGVLNFEDGILQQSINLQLADNKERNPDVVLELELFEPSRKTSLVRERMRLLIQDDDMRPGYLEMAEGGISVVESEGVAVIRVIRVGGSDGDLTVQWRAVGGTAKVGVDFSGPAPFVGNLSFAEGETENKIEIGIVDDEVREAREEFEVELFGQEAGPGVINFRARGTMMKTVVHIDDDDMSPGYPEMAEKKISVTEGEGRVTIRVVRREGTDGEISIRWRVLPGSAVPPLDYVLPGDEGGRLLFAENVTEQKISVRLVDDDTKEEEESFRVELFDPRPGPGVVKFRARGTIMTTDVVIRDDDMTPGVLEFERSRHVISERVEALRVWVVRVGGMDGEVLVHWRTVVDEAAPSRSRAEPGSDFKLDHGKLVFKPEESRRFFKVHLVDDERRETEERFAVELYDPQAGPRTKGFKGIGEVGRTIIVIHDDDMNPGVLQLESSSVSVAEGVGVARLGVERVGGSEGDVRVHWKATGGGGFFVPTTGELVFQEGETRNEIVVQLLDDTIRNTEERKFEVRLFDPTAGLGVVNFKGLGERTRADVTVLDDDMQPGVLSLESVALTVSEGSGVVRVGVVRLKGSDGQVSVQWRTRGGTATEGVDFATTEGELVFEDGVKLLFVEVRIVDDKVREDVEHFEVELVDFRLETTMKATVTILDDDSNAGTFGFRDKHVKVDERAGVVTLWVVRGDGADGRVKLKWRTTDGTAADGRDFAASGGGLVQFEDGEQEKSFFIPLLDRKGRAGGERAFTVGLFDPSEGGRLGKDSLVTVLIHGEEDSVRIFFRNSTVQVSRGSPEVTLEVERGGGDLSRPISVLFETVDGAGTARADADFRRTRGLITFPPPSFAMRVRVLLLGERPGHATPTWFMARISNPSEGEVVQGRDLVVVWIVDSESPQATVEQIETTRNEGTRDLEFRGQTKEIPCPAGMTMRDCAPACQGVCPGLDPVCPPPAQNGCVKGCFCPPGMLLDHTLARCVTLAQCTVTPSPSPPPVVVTSCPVGMTLRECAPACQGVCPGLLEPVCQHDATRRGCVKGCFCPPGMLLDHTLTRCLLPDHCASSPAPAGNFVGGQLVRNVGGVQSAGFQVKVDRTKVESRGGIQPPPPPSKLPQGGVCPVGLTFKECAPACQATCPGLEHASCSHGGGCVKGCFCPRSQVLDHTLAKCIHPSRCGGGQSERNAEGLAGGLLGGLLG